MAEYRQRTVSKQKKDKLRLPEYTTRTVVIWGLKDEEKSASFIKDIISVHARIVKITIIKRKPAVKVQFRTIDDAIKIRSNRKILKQWPHLYMKYGRDQNKNMKRPDNEQPDEEVDELANLAGSFKLGPAVVENEDLEEMSVADDMSEQQLLMQKLKEQQELQKLIQDEMDTQSLATTVPPALSQITFNVPEQDQIKLLEILSDELIDTELMNEESGSIKCRFAILTPAAWINWIKGQIGLDITKNDVHVNKDESKVFIRFFSLAEARMIDDAFDGVLIIHTPDHPTDMNFAKSGLTDIMCNVPLTPTELTTDEQTKETRQKLKNALRQSFSKFASKASNP